MSKRDSATEDLIKDTAKRIFFAEGRFNATTQEIADAAGVNRTLVHYYFRSKDQLFKRVMEDGRNEFHKKMEEMDHPELSFKQKMKHLINIWMEQGLKYPFLDSYLLSQIIDPKELDSLIEEGKHPDNEKIEGFLKEIKKEMKAGNIVTMNPVHFLLNMASLISYPIIMRPLLERTLPISKKEFDAIMADREAAILKTLFLK
jgi:AcrR family transcriptional regulator